MAMIAENSDMRTIVEFVEQETTLQYLKEFGVGYTEGLLLGNPGPLPNM